VEITVRGGMVRLRPLSGRPHYRAVGIGADENGRATPVVTAPMVIFGSLGGHLQPALDVRYIPTHCNS